MDDQKSSPSRVAFGVFSVLIALYGAYSLVMSFVLLITAAKAPAPPSIAEAKALQDAGAQIGANYVAFAAEFGALRGLLCIFFGLGGLIYLSMLETMERNQTALGHIWRELAAKRTP